MLTLFLDRVAIRLRVPGFVLVPNRLHTFDQVREKIDVSRILRSVVATEKYILENNRLGVFVDT